MVSFKRKPFVLPSLIISIAIGVALAVLIHDSLSINPVINSEAITMALLLGVTLLFFGVAFFRSHRAIKQPAGSLLPTDDLVPMWVVALFLIAISSVVALGLEPDQSLRAEDVKVSDATATALIEAPLVKKRDDSKYDCSDVFESLGVRKPDGSYFILDAAKNSLHIVNTPADIDLIKDILASPLAKDLAGEKEEGKYWHVSLVSLIALPEKYTGKLVITSGYFVAGHRSIALLLHKEDAIHGLLGNGIGLAGSSAVISDKQNSYVFVKGVFHAYASDSKFPWRGYLEASELLPAVNRDHGAKP